jgi:hypothetical protein
VRGDDFANRERDADAADYILLHRLKMVSWNWEIAVAPAMQVLPLDPSRYLEPHRFVCKLSVRDLAMGVLGEVHRGGEDSRGWR